MDIVIGCWISEPKQLLTSHVCLSVAAILWAKLTNAVDADTFFLLSVADHFSCQQLQLASVFFYKVSAVARSWFCLFRKGLAWSVDCLITHGNSYWKAQQKRLGG